MAEDYKHISVEEDDEEEVFVVGARAVEPDLVPDFVDDPVPVAPAAPVVGAPAAPAAPTAPAAPAGDLDVPPMSLLQKVIIGFAIVGVIVLAVYLFLN